MRSTRAFAWTLAVAVILAGSLRAADTPEDAAQAAAEAWLKGVDSGGYEASWDQAAKAFRGAVTKEQWKQAIGGVRTPMGRLVSRKVNSRLFTETLAGAPDGKYVVIQFDSVFEKKAAAIETVTPMLDPDGVWRVAGYFIR
jgi:hypothetical protein